ncbi:MAG: hypothetical protein QM764_20745 [Chitinophagaceae bacterium]
MRRTIKDPNSKVLLQKLKYEKDSSQKNKKISKILMEEQKCYCAYTDQYIGRADAADIDHFNPTLKYQPEDNYENWFVVKHQWNKEKSDKWDDFQPVLHPTAPDLETRIMYSGGHYLANSDDAAATNLIRLIKLDDPILAENRRKYIARKRADMAAYSSTPEEFFRQLLVDDQSAIIYPRAIKEEFNVDVFTLE